MSGRDCPPLPPTRMRHRGDKISEQGNVSALCFKRPRAIDAPGLVDAQRLGRDVPEVLGGDPGAERWLGMTTARDRFATLKDEARLNVERIDPMGVKINAHTMRTIVQPALDELAKSGEPDTRCSTCAFRPGTVPAGCIATQADALKAILEDVPFMCHAHMDDKGEPTRVCHEWFAARAVTPEGHKVEAPWPWTADVGAVER